MLYFFCNAYCRWELLDFAELKQSSVSFFDIEKPETAISRWSRARKRAAKVSRKFQFFLGYIATISIFQVVLANFCRAFLHFMSRT